jgi:tetratricopeptide (TPR) repeat protein
MTGPPLYPHAEGDMRHAVPLLLAALLACATARSPVASAPPAAAPQAAPVTFPPEDVQVSKQDLELVGKNDEELFAIGTAAFGAGDAARAAAAFDRVAELFPTSRHEAAALFNAGLAHEKLEEWDPALARFRTLERKYEGKDALEASFKVAECLYHLGDLAGARDALDAIAKRPGLGPDETVRALAQRGVVELELERTDAAEKTLRLALSLGQKDGERGAVDPYWIALAQYHLGEVYRAWFRALPLDPATSDEAKLGEDLEHKAEMLLSAQGHYLRTIRLGDDRWAVAAGFRIGELYDELRRVLLEAPLPPGLEADEADAYRAELRRRVRVLAGKAIVAYEQTLARAARTGVDDVRFLADAQASLARLKDALKDETTASDPRT